MLLPISAWFLSVTLQILPVGILASPQHRVRHSDQSSSITASQESVIDNHQPVNHQSFDTIVQSAQRTLLDSHNFLSDNDDHRLNSNARQNDQSQLDSHAEPYFAPQKMIKHHVDEMALKSDQIHNPCDMPNVREATFEEVCLRSYRKRFVCAIPNTQYNNREDLSLSELNALEKILKGMFAYCHYDTLLQAAEPVAIGDFDIKREFEEERVRVLSEYQQHGEDRGTRNHLHDAVQDLEVRPKLLIRPLNYRPTISITLFNDFWPNMQPDPSTCHRIEQDELTGSEFGRLDTRARRQFYANVTRAKWSYVKTDFSTEARRDAHNFQSPQCETDISILVLTSSHLLSDDGGRFGASEPMPSRHHRQVVVVSFSQYYGHLFLATESRQGDLNQVLYDINNAANMTLYYKLRSLLDHFLEVLLKHQPLNEKPQYNVPPWAIYVFVGCAVLSTAAAAVGSWINTKSRSRTSTTANAPASNRKWAAGFSGGLWAS